ncbi:hypothetical protein LPYR103PRE_12830 [Segatella asaccharophila]
MKKAKRYYKTVKYGLAAVLFLQPFRVAAKTNIIEKRPFSVALEASMDSYSTWSLLPSISFRPIPYFEVSAGLRLTDFIGKEDDYSVGGVSYASHHLWNLHDPSDFIYHFAFQPEAKVYLPEIKLDNVGDRLFLTLGVGMIKPLTNLSKGLVEYFPEVNGYVGVDHVERIENRCRDMNWYTFGETAVGLTDDRWTVSLGYRLSDYDVYGSARELYVQGQKVKFDKEKSNSELFLSISYTL